MNVCIKPQWAKEIDDYGIFSDFTHFATGQDGWTSLVVDGGSSASVSDGVRGTLAIVTGATDENEADVRTTTELFLGAAGKPLWGRGRIQFTDVNTDDGNIFFGFANALAANMLVDAGAGMRTSGSILAIYKIDGGTVWRCHSRDNSAATDTVSTTTAGGSSYVELGIEAVEYSTLAANIIFTVDGNPLRDTNGNVITHRWLYASLTEMNFGAYAKTGDATPSSLTLNVDWMGAGQVR